MDFNPRATYVARLHKTPYIALSGGISIHAPLTWRDKIDTAIEIADKLFQSTRHLRGATSALLRRLFQFHISIHAPLTWRDL